MNRGFRETKAGKHTHTDAHIHTDAHTKLTFADFSRLNVVRQQFNKHIQRLRRRHCSKTLGFKVQFRKNLDNFTKFQQKQQDKQKNQNRRQSERNHTGVWVVGHAFHQRVHNLKAKVRQQSDRHRQRRTAQTQRTHTHTHTQHACTRDQSRRRQLNKHR